MSHGKGKRAAAHEEEHENHERWAVSYSDMMTVLMALFLVLFAMSNVDQKKYLELKTSLAQGFGSQALPTEGGSGIVDGSTKTPVDVGSGLSGSVDPTVVTTVKSDATTSVAGPAQGTGAGDELAARVEAAHLNALKDQVNGELDAKGLKGAVTATITERGLEITVVADDIFFRSASAQIQPRGVAVLDAVGPALAATGEQVSVEGHANTLALSAGGQYATNWELSSARATEVLRHLTDADGVAADRLRAVGYGDAHPLYTADDPRAVDGNRRVDIVVESSAAPAVRALLPTVAGTAGTAGSATDATAAAAGVAATGGSSVVAAGAAPADVKPAIAP